MLQPLLVLSQGQQPDASIEAVNKHMNGSGTAAAMPGPARLRSADRWIADRVEYLRVPDFLDAGDCNQLIALARARPGAGGWTTPDQ
jgi:hypothetical protein